MCSIMAWCKKAADEKKFTAALDEIQEAWPDDISFMFEEFKVVSN